MRPPTPQFSLGKSFPGFGPTGPWLVSADELDDPDDLRITCSLNGEQVQSSRTSDLVFPVPHLVSYLSSIVPLLPGDLIFTGTPPGIGGARKPPYYLRAGDRGAPSHLTHSVAPFPDAVFARERGMGDAKCGWLETAQEIVERHELAIWLHERPREREFRR
jgi:hypothetical protein